MGMRKVDRLKAEIRLRSSSKSLQQPVDVVELDFRTEALAGATAQFVQDLTCLLQGILVGDFNITLVIVAVVRHRSTERIALDPIARQSVCVAYLVIPRAAPLP